MPRAIVAIMAIVVVGAVAVFGLQAAAVDAGTDRSVDGESFTPDAGNVTALDHSNLDDVTYDEGVTVYDSEGGVVNPDSDYVWYQGNGTLRTVAGGALDGDASATIDYGYQTRSEDQQALIGLVAMLPRIVGVLVPVLGVALLFVLLRG